MPRLFNGIGIIADWQEQSIHCATGGIRLVDLG
jgi:hypothetical protein